MEVMHVKSILDGMESDFVGAADGLSTANSAAGHPHGKAVGVMIPSVPFFAHGGTTEFAAPDHQSRVEQSALLKVCQQTGDGTV